MKYRESARLQFLNLLSELVLLVGLYFLAGLARHVLPISGKFGLEAIRLYFPVGLLYSFEVVLCFSFMGVYRELETPNRKKMILSVVLVNFVCASIITLCLFVLNIFQFSRLLLLYYLFLSIFFIILKRLIVDALVRRYMKDHGTLPATLLIGSGVLATRFYETLGYWGRCNLQYVGYVSEEENPALGTRLGSLRELGHILTRQHIDQILIAEDNQSQHQLQHILALADRYGIRTSLIPIYTDYVPFRGLITSVGGMQMIELKLLDTCNIMGVNIVVTDMQKTLATIEKHLETWRGQYICVANVHTTVTASEDQSYRQVQNGAVMALPDGGPLSQFSRSHGYTEAKRVTGPDLMKEILKMSGEKGWRHYFFGSTPETLEKMQAAFKERYPGCTIAGMYSPPFRPLTPEEDEQIVRMINEAKPDFVWVGLGAPKQERWMAAHEDRIQALMIGVGAAFDYEAGNILRAPMWMQRMNLEWLYRMLQDPKRLFKRYLTTNLKYIWWTMRK